MRRRKPNVYKNCMMLKVLNLMSCDSHTTLTLEYETYCNEIVRHVEPVFKKVHDLLMDYGLTPAPYDVKVFEWLSNGFGSLASAGHSFGALKAVVAA
jgi:hypothetical protein